MSAEREGKIVKLIIWMGSVHTDDGSIDISFLGSFLRDKHLCINYVC